jgi:hypothetical protein
MAVGVGPSDWREPGHRSPGGSFTITSMQKVANTRRAAQLLTVSTLDAVVGHKDGHKHRSSRQSRTLRHLEFLKARVSSTTHSNAWMASSTVQRCRPHRFLRNFSGVRPSFRGKFPRLRSDCRCWLSGTSDATA